jgi:hypothetical protein
MIVCSVVMGTISVDEVGAAEESAVRSTAAGAETGGGDCTSAMVSSFVGGRLRVGGDVVIVNFFGGRVRRQARRSCPGSNIT